MKFFRIFTLVLIMSITAFSQYYEKSRYSGVGLPFFEAEVFRTFTEDGKNKIYIYNEILYDDITFIKTTNNNYQAEIEFVIAIFDEDENQIFSKNTRKSLKETEFDMTNSRDETVVMSNDFKLSEGEFQVKLQMNDLNSRKSINRNVKLELEDLSGEKISISDILFLEKINLDSSGKTIDVKPRIQNNFPAKEGLFYVYFNVLSDTVPSQQELNYKFQNKSGTVEVDSTIEITIDDTLTEHYFSVDKTALQSNSYKVILSAGNITRSKLLSFYWVTSPTTSEDITMALRQMMYIIDDDSLDYYKEQDLETQKEFFERYWASRDPNPETENNELLEEYYKRVNLANREYSTFNENGWLTDRGRILIKFGMPDDIERHPFEINSVPYEIWRYYNLRKTFVFADRTGFGDYQLLPEYMDQEWR